MSVARRDRGRPPGEVPSSAPTLSDSPMPEIEIALLAAPPDHYLRWMAYWREIERKMLERPALERLASAESAPFLHDPVARFASELVREVTRQALLARHRGEAWVSPRVSGEERLFDRTAEYMVRRNDWLDRPGVSQAMGILPLEPELRLLRVRCVQAIREQIASSRA